jgi:hypothetical protein
MIGLWMMNRQPFMQVLTVRSTSWGNCETLLETRKLPSWQLAVPLSARIRINK